MHIYQLNNDALNNTLALLIYITHAQEEIGDQTRNKEGISMALLLCILFSFLVAFPFQYTNIKS